MDRNTTKPVVKPRNLAAGLFTDITPLLTLFGDEVTKQFLATSMGWGDDLLLGLAPLGLMTIIVSTIRIAGFRFMKALIGRARDSPEEEEKDILSSTSESVREIWDGNRVIRQCGESQTTEYVYVKPSITNNLGNRNKQFITLDSALNEKPAKPAWYHWKATNESHPGADKATVDEEKASPASKTSLKKTSDRILGMKSPNLTLNIPRAIPSTRKIWVLAIIGFTAQSVVFVFNGLGTYYWKWPRDGAKVASYGYPVWAVGTLIMILGIVLCGRIVESCTEELTAEPKKEKDMFRIVRLQKASPVQNRPAFAIFNNPADPTIRTSKWTIRPQQRREQITNLVVKSKSQAAAIQTVIGTILALIGFVCQNVGTRELHFSGAVSQLVAILFLTVLRAYARRNLGNEPFRAERLQAEVEAADMACLVQQLQRCQIHIGIKSICTTYELPVPAKLEDSDQQRSFEKSNSDACILERTFVTVKTLEDFQPLGDSIKDTARNVYISILAILEKFGLEKFSWNQMFLFQRTGNQEVLIRKRINFMKGERQRSSKEAQFIQRILALSMVGVSNQHVTRRIIGHSVSEEDRKLKLRQFKELGVTYIIDKGPANNDGVADSEWWGQTCEAVLGMAYSSIVNSEINQKSRGISIVDFVIKERHESSVLTFGHDLIANFLLELVIANPEGKVSGAVKAQKKSAHGFELFNDLAKILVTQDLTTDFYSKAIIIPAFVAGKMLPP